MLSMIVHYLSSPATVNKISFALGWVLIITMSSWPGSLAIQITMAILFILFVISMVLCMVTHGKLFFLNNDISRNKLVDSSLWVAWILAFAFAGFSSPLVKEAICNAATVILVVGLIFYPSAGSTKNTEAD